MASPAQFAANQTNAILSTGPRTVQGRERSSRNALTHGATSRQRLSSTETQEEYDAFEAAVFEHHQPANSYEHLLTEKISLAAWHHHRMLRMQAGSTPRSAPAINQVDSTREPAIAPAIDPEVSHFMGLMTRYVAASAREWKQAVAALDKVQNERRVNSESAVAPEPAAVQQPAEVPESEAVSASTRQIMSVPRAQRRAVQRAQCKAWWRRHARMTVATGIGFVSLNRAAAA